MTATFSEEYVKETYFLYLYDFIEPPDLGTPLPDNLTWYKQSRYLHHRIFRPAMPMDENRAEDGKSLRYRFVLDHPEFEPYRKYLAGPCSMLEMMAALAIRIEETIMDDPRYGNRTFQWYRKMIKSLGLGGNTDKYYDEDRVIEACDIFMRRDYAADGEGGLFKLKRPPADLRDVEIWVQANWYINELIF